MNRLKAKYHNEAIASLKKEFGYTNVMAIPKITKVVVNMGLGEATGNAKIIDTGADELARVMRSSARTAWRTSTTSASAARRRNDHTAA